MARNAKVRWRVLSVLVHDIRADKFVRLCEAHELVEPSKEVPRGKSASIG